MANFCQQVLKPLGSFMWVFYCIPEQREALWLSCLAREPKDPSYATAPKNFLLVRWHFNVGTMVSFPSGIKNRYSLCYYICSYEPTFEEGNWIAWQVLGFSLNWVPSETSPLPHSPQSCFLMMLMCESAVVLSERREKLTCYGRFYLQNHYQNQHWVACTVGAWLEVYLGFVQ